MSKEIPIVILNGFLGSGKTTLFRSLLSQSKRKDISVCAIVNDMSELDVDGELISNSAIVEKDEKILQSINSNILSSKEGLQKLDQAINKLLSNNDPDLIIIETSGSCHPMPLIKYFKNHNKVYLTGVLALVDSLMISQDFNCGKNLIPEMQQNMQHGKRGPINLLVEQILFCSHVILTKEDRINNSDLKKISNHINQINPFASIDSIIFGKLSIESLFEINEYNYYNVERLFKELQPVLDLEENNDRPYNLATRVIKDDRPFHPQRLWDVCHQFLDKRIYRSKGFFWLASRDNQSLLWNQSAGSISLEILGTWRAAILEDKQHGLLDEEVKLLRQKLSNELGRFGDRCCDLTIIGDKQQVDQFSEKIRSCFLTEKEIQQWQNGDKFKDPWPKNIVRVKN
jgi:G3E family GTPase|tara:strand:- start:599 stop:1798 length:1200 start_codon:yes stop_codon:yes gene_type:complete